MAVTRRLRRFPRCATPYEWRSRRGYIGSLATQSPTSGGHEAVTSDPLPRTLPSPAQPADKALQLQGCALLSELFGANSGNCLAAANARALPVLLRALKQFGQESQP